MSDLVTVAVTAHAHKPDGTPLVGAKITFDLDRFEIDDGHVVPNQVVGVFDEDGNVTVDVWPNERGTNGSKYRVLIKYEGENTLLDGTAVLPDLPAVDLDDYLVAPPYPPQTVLEGLVSQAQESAAAAISAADTFVNIDGGTLALGDEQFINGGNIDGGSL